MSFLLRLYQYTISPALHALGGGCRFAPSCSEYAQEAIERFGILKGSLLTLKRLSRCHPWGGSGFDPVPDSKSSQ